jgi:hypothetical protein
MRRSVDLLSTNRTVSRPNLHKTSVLSIESLDALISKTKTTDVLPENHVETDLPYNITGQTHLIYPIPITSLLKVCFGLVMAAPRTP